MLKALWAEKFGPGRVDRYLARHGSNAQQTDEPADPEATDHLFQPLPGDAGAHGRFDARARTFSLELWLSRHRAWLALVGGAVLVAVGGAGRGLQTWRRRRWPSWLKRLSLRERRSRFRSREGALLPGPLESVRAPRQYRGMATYLALLRGINVGGHKKIPMGELRTLCEELGYSAVQTYIQSGNVIFAGPAKTTAAAVETALEKALAARFGFAVDVLVRTAKEWPTLLRSNPFSEAALQEPQHLMMALAKRPLSKDCAAALRERAKDGEEIAAVGEVLWINYGGGMARSKLSPALIDRLAGSPVTARNLRTVQKLMELCADVEANQR